MRSLFCLVLVILSSSVLFSQKILMQETASLDQVYGEAQESEDLLPMNDLGIQSGYMLYEAEVDLVSDDPVLEVENVRDYASVYIDNKMQGELTGDNKKLTLSVSEGKHHLALYVENIGRITYGPEILDNSKGLFGSIMLDGEDVKGWKISVLNIRSCSVEELKFTKSGQSNIPAFYKGEFEFTNPENIYLDMSGWGMGEVWINGQYQGAYWEKSPQKTIQIDSDILKKGMNEVIIFEIKDIAGKSDVTMINQPLFK